MACFAAFGGGGSQRVGSHHDPFAVSGQNQEVALGDRGLAARRLGVEGLEVDRGAGRQLLDLTLAELPAGDPADRLAGFLKAPP